LNLLLLIIAVGTFAFARYKHDAIESKTAVLFQKNANNPAELNRMRDQLAQMDLDKQQLARELDARMQYLQSLEGEDFYISIDTTKKTLQFRIGKDVVREAPVEIGEPKTLTDGGKTWTFSQLKGGFSVTGKDDSYDTPIPPWVYVMYRQPVPADRPTMHNWLGNHVIFLPNNYVIQSPPPPTSPLKGPKPGSFMVPDEDLTAIWPRITTQTRVYIF